MFSLKNSNYKTCNHRLTVEQTTEPKKTALFTELWAFIQYIKHKIKNLQIDRFTLMAIYTNNAKLI